MSVATILLGILASALVGGCTAFLLPERRLNGERPVAHVPAGQGERLYDVASPEVPAHEGRHRWTDDQDTGRLDDYGFRRSQ